MNDALTVSFAFIAVVCLFEISFFAYIFFTSDEISCNWIFCTFTNHVSSKSEQWDSQTCYKNGLLVDCSELDTNSWEWNK